jgi:hypothetical protein
VGKDTVSRVWRKTKGDWDAWNARSLTDEPITRLILDGTSLTNIPNVSLRARAPRLSPTLRSPSESGFRDQCQFSQCSKLPS